MRYDCLGICSLGVLMVILITFTFTFTGLEIVNKYILEVMRYDRLGIRSLDVLVVILITFRVAAAKLVKSLVGSVASLKEASEDAAEKT